MRIAFSKRPGRLRKQFQLYAGSTCKITPKNLKIKKSSYASIIIIFLDSIVVSISACHVEDPGSIPGRGVAFYINPKLYT